MKKTIFTLSALLLAIGGFLYWESQHPRSIGADDTASQNADTDRQKKEVEIPDNYTIQIMVREWGGRSRAEIDEQFGDQPDYRHVLADESGGYLTYMDGYDPAPGEDPENSATVYADGTVVEDDLEGPKASTFGEVKAILYQLASD